MNYMERIRELIGAVVKLANALGIDISNIPEDPNEEFLNDLIKWLVDFRETINKYIYGECKPKEDYSIDFIVWLENLYCIVRNPDTDENVIKLKDYIKMYIIENPIPQYDNDLERPTMPM